MIEKRKCEVCGNCMGYCTSKRKTCSPKCKQQAYRNRKNADKKELADKLNGDSDDK